MAVKTAKNGVIILDSGDTYAVGQANKEIYSIIINDTSGLASATLSDAGGNVLFVYSGSGVAGSFYNGIFGCVTTSVGLAYSGADTTAYIYVR